MMMTEKKAARVFGAIAILSILIFLINCAFYTRRISFDMPGNAMFDDAFMFVRYANSFLAGNGFSWNSVDGSMYGCTSVLYLFLITAARAATTILDAQLLLSFSFLFGVLSIAALTLLTRNMLKDTCLEKYRAYLLIVPCLALSYSFKFHSFTGMETTLALFANSLFLIALFKYSKNETKWGFVRLLFFGWLAYLSRPDSGLYLLFTPLLYLWQFGSTSFKTAAKFSLSFILLLALDTLAKQWLFNGIVPLGFFAKRSGYYDGFVGAESAVDGLIFFVKDAGAPFLLIIAFFVKRKNKTVTALLLVPLTVTFGYFLSVTQIMGGIGRYYFPALPFLVFIALLILKDFYTVKSAPPHLVEYFSPLRTVLVLATILLVSSVGISSSAHGVEVMLTGQPVHYLPETHFEHAAQFQLPEAHDENILYYSIKDFSDFLRGLPPDITFAATEHGLLSARFPHAKIIDMMGLHDKHIAREGFSAGYVINKKPDIIWFPHFNYTYHVSKLIDAPGFFSEYDFYPRVFRFGIALRKNSRHIALMSGQLNRHFSHLYPGCRLEDFKAIKTVK